VLKLGAAAQLIIRLTKRSLAKRDFYNEAVALLWVSWIIWTPKKSTSKKQINSIKLKIIHSVKPLFIRPKHCLNTAEVFGGILPNFQILNHQLPRNKIRVV